MPDCTSALPFSDILWSVPCCPAAAWALSMFPCLSLAPTPTLHLVLSATVDQAMMEAALQNPNYPILLPTYDWADHPECGCCEGTVVANPEEMCAAPRPAGGCSREGAPKPCSSKQGMGPPLRQAPDDCPSKPSLQDLPPGEHRKPRRMGKVSAARPCPTATNMTDAQTSLPHMGEHDLAWPLRAWAAAARPTA